MHELPKDLTNSVRSWRASIYGDRLSKTPSDLEKGYDGGYEEKDFERALSPTEDSSIVLVHTYLLLREDETSMLIQKDSTLQSHGKH